MPMQLAEAYRRPKPIWVSQFTAANDLIFGGRGPLFVVQKSKYVRTWGGRMYKLLLDNTHIANPDNDDILVFGNARQLKDGKNCRPEFRAFKWRGRLWVLANRKCSEWVYNMVSGYHLVYGTKTKPKYKCLPEGRLDIIAYQVRNAIEEE